MATSLKRSVKRDAILSIMRGTYEHPSAESVFEAVRLKFPHISLGTVYRNINLLREYGHIQSIAVVKGHERFDADMSDHTHFICEKCGAVMDLGCDENFEKTYKLAVNKGCIVKSTKLILYGVCHDCKSLSEQRTE